MLEWEARVLWSLSHGFASELLISPATFIDGHIWCSKRFLKAKDIGQINNNGDEEEEEEEEEQHHEEEEERVFENNIRIRNPDTRFADGGIKLGIHLRKGEHGFRVHKIIPGGLMDSENAIRENDLIVRVGDVEVTALSLPDLIDLFWESDINATLNLTIIRKSDDETDSGYLTYETRTLSFHINPKENTVSFERNVTVSSGRYQCFRPEDSSSQLYIDWKVLWKIQKCQQIAGPFSYLIRHIETRKFLCCTGNAVSMCAGDFNPGLSINADDRWFTREDKYFESLTNPASSAFPMVAVSKLEECLSKVQAWMSTNFLKLNADKTEVMVFGFRAQLVKFNLPSVTVAGVDVPVQTNPVRNLGVMFDSGMTMSAQVTTTIRSANYHLNNISRARKMLTTEAAKLAVHTLVTSRLDYCNSLLIGVNKS
ncbi:hypothetical protein BSL78_19820 [Apostichopus japonicus]|uniref:PDZ domain-containing protein n=1 Tax=Stichopus japonicus TaxID=307972 RepID=A0A2G8K5N0_STIJA|nr:hypothetical protein BSL78_19820 [Apostichopus japonicus]